MYGIDMISGVTATDYADNTGVPATSDAEPTGVDFSSILADAIKDQAASAGGTASGGLPGISLGYYPMQNTQIEEAIIKASSSGQIDDAQVALLMLCMMMQTSQDGDYSMLIQMMASMITQIQGDTGGLRNNIMSSEYDPYILETIDRGVFTTRMPAVSDTGQAVIPVEHWKPTAPVITSGESNRSAGLYRAVIDQFQVETAERYRPFRNGYTYCNIYVWDVTSAMGAQIPLYTDKETGEPRYYPDNKGSKSMGAIAMDKWLSTHGAQYGWREVDARTAQMHANQGRPAVTTAGSVGHVQMICPSRDGGYDSIKGVTVAQAGRIVTNYTYITNVYGSNSMNNKVRYWIHN